MAMSHSILLYTNCKAECSHFHLPQSNTEEWALQFHVEQKKTSFTKQLELLLLARAQFLKEHPEAQPVFIRVFLSDAANQEVILRAALPSDCGAVSIIEQAPLDGSKISLLLYLQRDVKQEYLADNALLCTSPQGHQHLWTASSRGHEGNAHEQCYKLFKDYSQKLRDCGGTLYANSIRTWLFVQNVDTNYGGVVTGRNEHFDEEGLTNETHFISSTGIQGRSEQTDSLVSLDSYSIMGLEPKNIQFLYAPDYLNPTHEYGVRFERGTALHFPDRTMSFISGTASIDNKGDVVHVGDIQSQCLRMWKNIDALLAEAGACMDESLHMIIYLRDIADYELINEMFERRFPKIPKIILLAPVCRPTWLIEMECITIS